MPLLQKNVTDFQSRLNAVADTASEWCDPEYGAREQAVAATVDAPNRWTEQALNHALNRWMQQLTVDRLDEWAGPGAVEHSRIVGVLHGSSEPLDGFRSALAVWILGHEYLGVVPEGSPALLPAFAEDVMSRCDGVRSEFVEPDRVYASADVVIVQCDDGESAAREKAQTHGIPASHQLIRPPTYSVGILDGHESEDEMGRLAEDMLLYEGMGRRRLALLWAPVEHPPDAYLEAMAGFRGLFPAHPDTPGTLQMQQAFLEARDESHAYAEGLEFLVSRGAPEPQRPGHIRWSEYEELRDVTKWVSDHAEDLHAIIARRDLHNKLPEDWPLRTPGGVHIPPLNDEDGREVISFLQAVGETVDTA